MGSVAEFESNLWKNRRKHNQKQEKTSINYVRQKQSLNWFRQSHELTNSLQVLCQVLLWFKWDCVFIVFALCGD